MSDQEKRKVVVEIAANIRAWRARSKQSQGDLAHQIGVDLSTIGKYESGEMVPGADKIFSMAQALGCTPNDLFGFPVAR